MMKRPVIDLGSCILCEICVEVAPHAFEIGDSGFVQVRPLDDYQDETILEAVKNCPKDCISWEED
ncbi:MAG: ferredoxin [Desulfotignum sp.]|nr:ferredoxin [Desulfotignum sp.]MCF8088384.1 ferredoxin [Desulfotignum sp.]MCF8139362.1 ferredoxin [Desulfotignum sp.]